ncbi:MAG TPA: hypothetical protein VGG33_22140 [Polyangia bacterium]
MTTCARIEQFNSRTDDSGEPRSNRRLVNARRGSITITTLFAASFIIGLLFAMHGIRQAIHHSAAKRDAADAAAFAAASIYARGMNQVALLNSAKVTVLSIYTSALASEIAGLPAASAFVAGMLAALQLQYIPEIPKLVQIGIENGIWLGTNGTRLTALLRAIDRAQDAIIRDTPLYANTRVRLRIPLAFPEVNGAFFTPPQQQLPLRPAPVTVPCSPLRLPALPYQIYMTFRTLNPVVMGVAIGAATAAAFPTCATLVAASGSTMEITDRLGSERFQVRGYAVGGELDDMEGGVRIATWRRNYPGGLVTELRRYLSTVGFAQAEYYSDASRLQTGPFSELMFSMGWRTRMRRYRNVDGFSMFGAGCLTARGGAACGPAALALNLATPLIIH